jgi:hypothetical protein
MRMVSRLTICCLALIGVCTGAQAQAGTIALGVTGGTVRTDFGGTVGYEITVGAQPISVSALGYYNGSGFQDNTGGIPTTHEVGIYNDATQALVGSATVTYDGTPAGPSSFTYVPVTPFILAANTKYDVAAANVSGSSNSNGNAAYLLNATGVSVAADLTLGNSRYGGGGSTLAFPNNTFTPNNVGNIGGNFQFSVVPEPSSLLLCGLGAFGLFIAAQRRRKA